MYLSRVAGNTFRNVSVRTRNQPFVFRASSTQVLLEQKLHQELVSRPVNTLVDYSVATPSRSLSLSLADFLPSECHGSQNGCEGRDMPIGHHIVYFPPQIPESQLLTDGTDPLHSPGDPYVRRMWAGGSVEFNEQRNLKFLAQGMTCREEIADVNVKGDKIFVGIQRSITNDHDEEPVVVENRNLVFMKEKSPEDAKRDVERASKIIRAAHEPDYSVSLTPSQALLFRFSALTFNAHRIHLDPQYAREVEGHRGLLVHGPLTLVLMLSVLDSQLGPGQKVKRFSYRNLAPLYAEEEMRVCVKRSRNGKEGFDVWIEGKGGGYAVKGSASIISK